VERVQRLCHRSHRKRLKGERFANRPRDFPLPKPPIEVAGTEQPIATSRIRGGTGWSKSPRPDRKRARRGRRPRANRRHGGCPPPISIILINKSRMGPLYAVRADYLFDIAEHLQCLDRLD
jgi:hypothetical protein